MKNLIFLLLILFFAGCSPESIEDPNNGYVKDPLKGCHYIVGGGNQYGTYGHIQTVTRSQWERGEVTIHYQVIREVNNPDFVIDFGWICDLKEIE